MMENTSGPSSTDSVALNSSTKLTHRRVRHRVVLERLFSPKILILLGGGIVLNSGIASIVNYLDLPLYMDNIGSLLAAALGGPLIGIVVGFLSNIITSLSSSPLSLYYGLITIMNAIVAADFSRFGYLKSWKGALVLWPILVFYGGFCGSLITWILYGATMSGKGGSLAMSFHAMGWSALSSQLMADILIDILDKGITIFIVIFFLRHYPKKWGDLFPLSHLYAYDDEKITQIDEINTVPVRKGTLASHTLTLTKITVFLLSAVLTIISCFFYAQIDSSIYTRLGFFIQIIVVEIGSAIIIIALLTWYLDYHITLPMNALVRQVIEFKQCDPETWLTSTFWKNRRSINSGDELETLYTSICLEEEKLSQSVIELRNSHRKLLEATYLKNQNQILSLQLERLQAESEAKAEFYSRMSHDIRTPMNSIIGFTQLALAENNIQDIHTDLSKMESASHYLLRLIDDALDMSKLDAKMFVLNPKPFNLLKALKELYQIVTISAQAKHLNLHPSYENFDPDIYIFADRLRLQQIYMNITSNAVNYTPEGGSIYLIARDLGSDEKTCRVRFIVKDTGVGMSADFVKNRLFHPFSQEANSESGKSSSTGLGLNIAKQLVELMNGTISCESELGCGSTFSIDFDFEIISPEKVKQYEISEAAHSTDAINSLAGCSVLLCEDNMLNQEIAKRILENVDINVTIAANGKQGVHIFQTSGIGSFNAILMDIRMPVMDGITAAQEIRALNRADASTIPIIAMTADVYEEDRRRTHAAGINAHLAKPIDAQELYNTLADFINM